MYIYNDGVGEVIFLDSMGSDETPAQAARVSFSKLSRDITNGMNDKDAKLIRYLAAHGHTSPFEHVTASFELTVPLFVRAQIMRHRTFSFNEISRRYSSKAIAIYHPQEIRRQAEKNLQCSSDELPENLEGCHQIFKDSARDSVSDYNSLLRLGVSRETARMVLPKSLYTSFWMTGNLHNWCKFIRLRTTEHVQLETRLAAEAIKAQLLERFPVSVKALLSDEYEH